MLEFLSSLTAYDVVEKLGLAYAVASLLMYLRTKPWNSKHSLPPDIMKKIANNTRPAPDTELFPQYFPSVSTGLWLYTREWLPPSGKPKGVFFIVPGMGEHTIRYEFLAAQMGKSGFACYSLDHQGMGASEGDRCHVERFSHYVQDFNAFVAHVLTRPEYSKLPRFLFGHSVGGLISIHMTTSHDFKHPGGTDWTGVVLSAPLIVPDPKVSQWWKVAIGKLLSNVVPKFVVTEPLPVSGISSNQQVFDLYRSDPHLYHGGLPARWGIEMFFALSTCQKELIAKFDKPFLILHGLADKIVAPSGSENFYKQAASTDKTMKKYEGACHEILNEPKEARHRVVADITAWVKQKM